MKKTRNSLTIAFRVALVVIFLVIATAVIVEVTTPSDDCVHHATNRIHILLDRTVRYTRLQRVNLDKSVADIVTQAPSNSQINVFYMTSDGSQPKTVLSLCRPNDRNPLGGDAEEARFRIQRLIIDAIRKVVDLPLNNRETSPIVETLDTLSRERLLSADNGQNTVYIFSDMLQSSSKGSLLSCTSSGEWRLDGLRPYISDVSEFYRDIPVHIYELVTERGETRQLAARQCVRVFWEHTLPDIRSWEPL